MKMMMFMMEDLLSKLGPSLATLVFIWTLYHNYFPNQLRTFIVCPFHRIYGFFYPYVHITFREFEAEELFDRSKVFLSIERYLGQNSTSNANQLIAKAAKDTTQQVVLSMGHGEVVTDVYRNHGKGDEEVKVWWSSNQIPPNKQTISYFPREEEKRFFSLKFHKKNREIITKSYIKHVLEEGEAIAVNDRKLKLYTNNNSEYWRGRMSTKWSHVIFKHPSNFTTLAMEPSRKQEIKDELLNFKASKELYARIGKAWKRGYLLHGPPGTGKSSMVAAMANLMQYDVYDLELTSVKDNNELRRLLIDTSGKSIIVIEDIDCSLDLTGQRKKKKEDEDESSKEEKDPIKKELIKKIEKKGSEVTLSGLLNVIDGLWSAIGEEKIIIFTTNHLEKLDPALIRRGRMDSHIEMSYCCFEAFKVLAKNYLDMDTEKDTQPHPLFPEIKRLLGETKVVPADVAENMMPKSAGEKIDTRLERLVKSLQEAANDELKMKSEEEKRIKVAKEEEDIQKKQEAEGPNKTEDLAKENGDMMKTDALVLENGNACEG
ncbi:unnamed protein product [Cuscuta epithymum]|uniref:AAA+ ATPase domain-containing protein n=1 Tax=Cuscuta epithymum TaxID=186058 RepID=A0AAV0GE35_9ASTE|nr:unnamed protein product [Cuscuta epithymum]